jgi:hypothetical protein
MRRTMIPITVIAACMLQCDLAIAQTASPNLWAGVYAGSKVEVVTMAEPKRVQKCHVKSFEVDQIVCSRRFGRKPVSYKREDVAAIIDPGKEASCWGFFGLAGGGVGAVTSAILLRSSPAIAVPLGIAGAVALWFSPSLLCADDGDGMPPRLLYLKPGEQLQSL